MGREKGRGTGEADEREDGAEWVGEEMDAGRLGEAKRGGRMRRRRWRGEQQTAANNIFHFK